MESLTADQKRAAIQSLPLEYAALLKHDWHILARDNQLPPEGDWSKWLMLMGRGAGKTRSGAEWVTGLADEYPGCRIAVVARTAADARDVIVEGESGILAVAPPGFVPEYMPSKRRVVWPNGSIATLYSGEEPDQLRGPQHHFALCDELASWKYPEAFDMLMFGLRLGEHPRVAITTTPKPVKLIKELIADPTCAVVRGSTYENRANLAPSFFSQIVRKYEGTRLGRQELLAEILDDNPGALWTRDLIEKNRKTINPPFTRVVVGVDPEATSGETAAETGIVVAGLATNGHAYVLDDNTIRGTPLEWGTAAVTAYHKHKADRVIPEINNGGEMIEYVIRTIDPTVAIRTVHASRSKQARAEPVAALYEQGRVHHLGVFAELEDQMCEWVPADGQPSPDRLDALVWALTDLVLDRGDDEYIVYADEPELISQY